MLRNKRLPCWSWPTTNLSPQPLKSCGTDRSLKSIHFKWSSHCFLRWIRLAASNTERLDLPVRKTNDTRKKHKFKIIFERSDVQELPVGLNPLIHILLISGCCVQLILVSYHKNWNTFLVIEMSPVWRWKPLMLSTYSTSVWPTRWWKTAGSDWRAGAGLVTDIYGVMFFFSHSDVICIHFWSWVTMLHTVRGPKMIWCYVNTLNWIEIFLYFDVTKSHWTSLFWSGHHCYSSLSDTNLMLLLESLSCFLSKTLEVIGQFLWHTL